MIVLPDGFDIALLVSDLTTLALPFVTLALLIASGVLILRLLKKV